jgi:tryptophanyl-tRNA synthetase
MLSGELKSILIEKINIFLADHQKKKEEAKKNVDKFLGEIVKLKEFLIYEG